MGWVRMDGRDKWYGTGVVLGAGVFGLAVWGAACSAGYRAGVVLVVWLLAIVFALRWIRPVDAEEGEDIDALVAYLRDPWVAHRAASALGRLGNRAAIDALRNYLADPRAPARREAILALASLRDRGSMPLFVDLALRGRRSEALAAIRAIGELGGEDGVGALAEVVQSASHPRALRVDAIWALYSTRHAAAVGVLATALRDETREISYAAAEALGGLGALARNALGALAAEQERRGRGPYADAISRIAASSWGEPAELEAARGPEGRGTEVEASVPPAGRGTEPEAVAEGPHAPA